MRDVPKTNLKLKVETYIKPQIVITLQIYNGLIIVRALVLLNGLTLVGILMDVVINFNEKQYMIPNNRG